jgi:hypothetical protein
MARSSTTPFISDHRAETSGLADQQTSAAQGKVAEMGGVFLSFFELRLVFY